VKKKKIIYIERKYLALIFLEFLLVIGIFNYLTQQPQEQFNNVDFANCNCPISFGKPECIDNRQYVPFFNPSDVEIEKIKLTAKKVNGYDIYEVDKPLKPDQTETLGLFKCYTLDEMKIDWCCGDECCQAPITEYSRDVTIAS